MGTIKSTWSHPARAPSVARQVARTADGAVARMLRVQPQRVAGPRPRRPYDAPLLIVGARCVIRYLVLPFALPILGVATGTVRGVVTGAAIGVLVALDVIAVISITTTLRWLWRHQHPHRWLYLLVALAMTILIAWFLLNDIGSLSAAIRLGF